MSTKVDKAFELATASVSRTLGKIHLNEESRNLLIRLGGVIQVMIDPGADHPIIRVVTTEGKTLCSISDFEKIAGYRRFLTEATKTAEKESLAEKRLAEVAKMISLFENLTKSKAPDRMIQENNSKRLELEQLLKKIKANVGRIKDLPESEGYKEYLLEMGTAIEAVLVHEMILVIGPEKVTKDQRMESLFLAKIPKWLYGKFISNDWVKNETKDIKSLVFPKNNFLKGIAFMTREIMDEDFMLFNHKVTAYSGHLPKLVTSRLVNMFLEEGKDPSTKEVLAKVFEDFEWVLHNGTPVDEIIQPRLEGKAPPSITITRSMAKGRETELPRLKRDMTNRLMRISHNLSMLMHGLILTEDPIGQFWDPIYSGANDWELTPTKNIYDWIMDVDPKLEKFSEIVHLSNPEVNKKLFGILFLKCEIYNEDLKAALLGELLDMAKEVKSKSDGEKPLVNNPDYHLEDITDVTTVSNDQKEKAKLFLGAKTKKVQAKKSRQNARLLSTKVMKGLRKLDTITNGKHIRTQIENWIETSFTTSGAIVQEVALELILAAAYREDLLEIDLEEESEDEYTSDD
jgi:hypothetical protein